MPIIFMIKDQTEMDSFGIWWILLENRGTCLQKNSSEFRREKKSGEIGSSESDFVQDSSSEFDGQDGRPSL